MELDKESILALSNVLSEKEMAFGPMWRNRHLEQFATCLESFEFPVIVNIIVVLLHERTAEDVTPAYINGNTLHYEAADGKMKSLPLKDERAFRKKFSEAQRLIGYPPWACIDQFPGEGNSIPSIGQRVNPKDRKSRIPIASWAKASKRSLDQITSLRK